MEKDDLPYYSTSQYLLLFREFQSLKDALENLDKYGGISITQDILRGAEDGVRQYQRFGIVSVVKPGDLIFLLEPVIETKLRHYWHVIVGERVGWICEGLAPYVETKIAKIKF
jgi:hypothetical protein